MLTRMLRWSTLPLVTLIFASFWILSSGSGLSRSWDEPEPFAVERPFVSDLVTLYECIRSVGRSKGYVIDYAGVGFSSEPQPPDEGGQDQGGLPRITLRFPEDFTPFRGGRANSSGSRRLAPEGRNIQYGESQNSPSIDLDRGVLSLGLAHGTRLVRLSEASVKFTACTGDGEVIVLVSLRKRFGGDSVELLPLLENVSDIPKHGKSKLILATVKNVIYFRMFDREGSIALDTNESELMQQDRRIGMGDCDLQILPSKKDGNDMPSSGRNLVIVGKKGDALRLRAFDGQGKMVADLDVGSMIPVGRLGTGHQELAGRIRSLERRLEAVSHPHKLSKTEKDSICSSLALILEDQRRIAVARLREYGARLRSNRQLTQEESNRLMSIAASLLHVDRFRLRANDNISVIVTSDREDAKLRCQDFLKDFYSQFDKSKRTGKRRLGVRRLGAAGGQT